MKYILLLTIVIIPSISSAETHRCIVEKKLDYEWKPYTQEKLNRYNWQVIIEDNSKQKDTKTILRRCSVEPSSGKFTCDSYIADWQITDSAVGHRKYYYFRGQFDVQLFSNSTFIENNGRGGLAKGRCEVIIP